MENTDRAERRKRIKTALVLELCDDSDINAAINAIGNSAVLARTALHIDERMERYNTDAHIENFVEITVPRYSDWQFKGHFRMLPGVFELFCEWVAPRLPAEKEMTAVKRVLATLWLVANKESYRSVADRFGINKGTLHRIVMGVCEAIVALRGDFIKWPRTRTELEQLSEDFQARAGFPGVVGAVDGTYIKIPGKTLELRDPWICRKGFPAMQLQVVCASDLRFLDVQAGHCGSVHDARVFRTSELSEYLESPHGRLPPDYHLLGDSAYPLKDYLLVPFRDNGRLTRLETRFNTAHSRTRVDVERAIGLLKGKFRRLKDLDMTNTLAIPKVIFACCVMHNFIIDKSGIDDEDIDLDSEDESGDELEDGGERVSGEAKRLQIAQGLE